MFTDLTATGLSNMEQANFYQSLPLLFLQDLVAGMHATFTDDGRIVL